MTKTLAFSILIPAFSLACSLGSCRSVPRPEPIIASDGAMAYGPARLEYTEGIPIISLSGSHYEMGVQYGVLLKKEYAESVAKTKEILLAVKDGSPPILGSLVSELFKAKVNRELLRGLPTKYRDELKGISRGSGVPFDDVVFAAAAAGTIDLACTSILSKNGDGILLGRNLDWAPGFFGSMPVVVRFRPEGEHSYVSAGFLALPMCVLTAMSEGGIALSVNIVACHEEAKHSGMPIYYLAREALANADALSDAEAALAEYRGSESWLVSMASGAEGIGSIVELTGREARVERLDEDGSMYALNGFRSEYMNERYSPLLDAVNVINDDRTRLIDELLISGKATTADGLLDILANDGSPTISESRWTGQGINHNGTLLTAVLDPRNARLLVGYARLYAGWAPVSEIGLEGGPARAYRPASGLASGAEYESIASWYPDFLLDLYGRRCSKLVELIESGTAMNPIAFDSLCRVFDQDPSTADADYLESALEKLLASPSEALFAIMPAADNFYASADYRRAQELYERALREDSLLPDDRLRALSRLAAISERRGDMGRAAGYARECIALMEGFDGSYIFGKKETRLISEMRGIASRSEGSTR
jgi:hypothetical protein